MRQSDIMDPADSNWKDTQARFDAIVLSLRSSARLKRTLPTIALEKSASGRVSARVRLASPGHFVVEFGAKFLGRLRRSIARIDDADLAALVTVDDAQSTPPATLLQVRTALYAVAEQFVLHHELLHVLGGHLDHLVSSSQGRTLNLDEHATSESHAAGAGSAALTASQELSLYLELEADDSALQFLADHCEIGDLTAALQADPSPVSEYTGSDRILAFRLLFAGVWLVLLELERPRRDHRPSSGQHPWPAARLMSLLVTLMPHFVQDTDITEDALGQRFTILTDDSAALTKQYMLEVVRQAMKFVVAQTDGEQVVARFREPDPTRSDLFADVLLDLHGLLFDDEIQTQGGRQLLALFERRRFYVDLLRPFRYLADE